MIQLKIRMLEMALREEPGNEDIKRQLAESRAELEVQARSAALAD